MDTFDRFRLVKALAWVRSASEELRRFEREYLTTHPGSLLCPACHLRQPRPGLCPACREAVMDSYRPH